MVKIAVFGTGGVGGFIGGRLAAYYEGSPEVEVYFISRGEALNNIRERGLILETDEGEFIARPKAVTDNPSEIGTMDYILFCTKTYDVEAGVKQIRPCVGEETVIIPFLNGVDGGEIIARKMPEADVWFGCVYIVAFILSPGRIKEQTNGYRYFFGSGKSEEQERAAVFEGLLTAAGIKASAKADIVRYVWDKFAYISTVASATSYTDKNYGEVLQTPEYKALLLSLLGEFEAVARKKGSSLSDNITDIVVERMAAIPAETTTSMQRDFRAGHRTEVESLTGYIVREGDRLGVAVPSYRKVYELLKSKTK